MTLNQFSFFAAEEFRVPPNVPAPGGRCLRITKPANRDPLENTVCAFFTQFKLAL